jgi:hypothetical protein
LQALKNLAAEAPATFGVCLYRPRAIFYRIVESAREPSSSFTLQQIGRQEMENYSTAAEKVLGFLPLAERLKRELRHSWLSDGRRESVAEHTWFTALMADL